MIKYVNLGISETEFDNEIAPLLKSIFLNGSFVGGSQIEVFEKNFAEYCGVEYAVALGSGTDALILALRAFDIGTGDEVITVANSFVATANAIVMVGARPVFVDIGEDLLMDVSKIEAAITPRTKAILPVHLTGLACDMDGINEIAKKYNLYVIEDAAQSAGSSCRGKKTGSLGNIGCFSLHPLKNLAGIGDGGILTTNNEVVATKIKMLRNHGLKNRNEQEIISVVSRLDTINATILNYRLSNIDNIIKTRIEKASLYNALLGEVEQVKVPISYHDRLHSYHVYVVRVEERERLIEYLESNGIETKIHYPFTMYEQKPYSQYSPLENTQKIARQILTLPIANVTECDIEFIANTVRGFYI
jgi:dTDP-4-amino-4,6-dideoxygalactose transaminase